MADLTLASSSGFEGHTASENGAELTVSCLPVRTICGSPYHRGPRWMLSIYFYRCNRRGKQGLQSRCKTCTQIGMRAKNLSDQVKRYRSEYSRKYKENKRRQAGIPIRMTINPHFDHAKLYAYLKRFITEEELSQQIGNDIRITGGVRLLLNGIVLTPNDNNYIRKMRNGKVTRPPLPRIDEIATRYELPLWEMQEAAGCYKKDIRAVRRDKRIKATAQDK